MHEEILDKKRQTLLPQLAQIGEGFYLAGGTSLALQIGHRDSVDFDFFKKESFDTRKLFVQTERVFEDCEIKNIQEERNTLSILVEKEILISFFSYTPPLVKPTVNWKGIKFASIEDIAVMKLSAITSRATMKDYVDLYFILQIHPIESLIHIAKERIPSLNEILVLKSLVYFEDIKDEPLRFIEGHEVSLEIIRSFLKNTVRSYKSTI